MPCLLSAPHHLDALRELHHIHALMHDHLALQLLHQLRLMEVRPFIRAAVRREALAEEVAKGQDPERVEPVGGL